MRTRWRGASALAGMALVAAPVAFIAALFDRAAVTGQAGLSRVMFGYPLDWLAQDQTASDPPFPATIAPASPWENPTSVTFGPLIVDVLFVYAVLLVAWLVGCAVVRRLRSVAT